MHITDSECGALAILRTAVGPSHWSAVAAVLSVTPMQFEMRLQSAVGEFYQHCNRLLPDCTLLLANSNQVEFD